jgi:hypothetical protein
MQCKVCLKDMVKFYIGTPNDTPLLTQNIGTKPSNRYSPTFAVVAFPTAIEHFETFATIFVSLPSTLIETTYLAKFYIIYFRA